MEQKYLSKWLRLILIGTAFCGLILYTFIIPDYGLSLRSSYPEFSACFWPWLIFIWVSGIPCFTVLYFAWKISANIGKDLSFTEENAALLKSISLLAVGDTAFFFLGNIILFFLNMSHPSIVIASFVIVFFGVAVAVASALLSYLVKKAAQLQEQSDLTI